MSISSLDDLEKDSDTILAEMIASIQEKDDELTDFNSGSVARTFLESFADAISNIMSVTRSVVEQSFIQNATGDFVDLKAEEIGLSRKEAIKTQGYVTFTRDEDTDSDSNITIPLGTLVKTGTSTDGNYYRYQVLSDTVLSSGNSSINVLVEADDTGEDYNVAALSIKYLETPISGIASVSNLVNWVETEGCDEESDEDLIERYLAEVQSGSGSNAAAYKSWVTSVDGVAEVTILPLNRGAGTVDIVFTSTAGIPSDDLIAEVQAIVDENKPVTADVEVSGPTEVSTDFNYTLVLYPSYGDYEGIMEEVQTAISEAIFNLNVGDDLSIDFLKAKMMSVEGVKKIYLTAPFEDVEIESLEMITLGTIADAYAYAEQR